MKIQKVPLPSRGVNLLASKGSLLPEEALSLDNIYFRDNALYLRRGSQQLVSGLGAPVKTLFNHITAAGVERPIVGYGTTLGFMTSTTAPGVLSGTTQAINDPVLSCHNFGGRAYIANSHISDPPYVFDASVPSFTALTVGSWSTTAPTNGVNDLTHPASYLGALYWIERETASIWYMQAEFTTGGLFSHYDLSFNLNRGGKIVGHIAWSPLQGQNNDYMYIAISSTGEIVAFSGINPGHSTWRIVRRINIPKPVSDGHRVLVRFGSDVYIITEVGPVSLQAALQGEYSKGLSLGGVEKVTPPYRTYSKTNGVSPYWTGVLFSKENMLIFTINNSGDMSDYQIIYNIDSNTWATFTGWNILSICENGDSFIFGDKNGRIMRGWSGDVDSHWISGAEVAVEITGNWVSAYQTYGAEALKKLDLAQVYIRSSAQSAILRLQGNYDFIEGDVATNEIQLPSQSFAFWDTFFWDTTPWSSEVITEAHWYHLDGVGKEVGISLELGSNSGQVAIDGVKLAYQEGGGL